MRNVATSALLLLAASATAESAWQKKVSDFRSNAREQRQKLGLKNEPTGTPELAFVTEPAANGLVVLCPGQKVEVKLKTNLPAGSLFVATSDDVAISNDKLVNGVWTATLSARPVALPRPFDLRGVHGTSGREASLGRFLLGCKHTLVVDTDGARLTVKLDFTTGRSSLEAPGEWSKGGKPLGSSTYTVSLGVESINLERRATPDEGEAQVKTMMASLESPERKALDARLQAAMKKMDPCGKLKPEKMGPCFAAVQPEINSINAELAKLNDAANVASAPKVGCSRLSLDFTANGLEGDASTCPARKTDERIPAKGTITTP
ncbi:MAG: hypothetical protein JNJ54_03795 [Myxococcaceae bacterium]|nr:hypothetical protein [Myxococcaceae bacterium]